MQCPRDLSQDGFELIPGILFPWCDYRHTQPNLTIADRGERQVIAHFHQYTDKIKPLLVGTRRLAITCGYRALKRGSDRYYKAFTAQKEKRFMCYFGDANGPVPETEVTAIDYDWERDILAKFAGQVEHPNVKRAVVADMIAALDRGGDCDARIINRQRVPAVRTLLGRIVRKIRRGKPQGFVPLRDFCAFVSQFQYNFNVNGHRRSLPNRFMDSFMVGTAIVTSKMNVRWYLPFSPEEGVESGEMDYLPTDRVDWATFQRTIAALPRPDARRIRQLFDEKWAPEVVARYMINTIKNSKPT